MLSKFQNCLTSHNVMDERCFVAGASEITSRSESDSQNYRWVGTLTPQKSTMNPSESLCLWENLLGKKGSDYTLNEHGSNKDRKIPRDC